MTVPTSRAGSNGPMSGEDAAPVGHVRPRAELAGAPVMSRGQLPAFAVDAVGAGGEAAAEAAIALEELLGLGLQLVGHDQAGDGHDLGLLGEDAGQGADPVGVDDDVVVGVGQDVAVGLGDGTVAGPVEAGHGFADIAHPGVLAPDQVRGGGGAGGVVDDEEVEGGVVEAGEGGQAVGEQGGAVAGADGHRHQRPGAVIYRMWSIEPVEVVRFVC